MFLVVGLGNPGKKYERTRHNAGFHVLDRLAERHGFGDAREKFKALVRKGTIANEDITALAPQTFMNLSGESVQPAQAFLKVPLASILVVHDELDLPFGEVRIKVGGGSAGHNGLKSLTQHLGADYVRVRVGVGRPPAGFRGDVADWVLAEPSGVEAAEWPDLIAKASAAVEAIVEHGVTAAMNKLNTKSEKKPKPKSADAERAHADRTSSSNKPPS